MPCTPRSTVLYFMKQGPVYSRAPRVRVRVRLRVRVRVG